MNELYNPEVKENFLKSQSPNSYKVYHRVLAKIAVSERFYGKDVSSFIPEEYTELLHSLNASSPNSIATQHSVIHNYIKFAVENGGASPNRLVDNVAAMFTNEELEQFIRADARENQILTSDELDEFVDFCYNEQDAALVQALREGIKGIGSAELINLKICDIDAANKTVQLHDRNASRTLEISPKAIDLLLEAHHQEKYWRRNGESTSKKSTYFYLPQTEYVFKPNGQHRMEPVNAQILRRRLNTLANWHGNPFLNVTNVWKSGAAEYGRQLMKEYGVDVLETRHYEMICERYGINPARTSSIRQSIGEYIDGVARLS